MGTQATRIYGATGRSREVAPRFTSSGLCGRILVCRFAPPKKAALADLNRYQKHTRNRFFSPLIKLVSL